MLCLLYSLSLWHLRYILFNSVLIVYFLTVLCVVVLAFKILNGEEERCNFEILLDFCC